MPNTNPFTFGSMITDPQRFIGRRAQLETITARLNSAQPQGSAVVGLRRIGKSSLLHYLYRPREGEELRPAEGLRVIYFSAAEGSCGTPEQFRAALVRALLHDLRLDRRTTEGRWLAELQERLAAGEPCPWDTARRALDSLPFHPVVCLDEFEALLGDTFEDRFFTALRNWANEGLLTWITASARPLPELGDLHGRTSPFFNLLATVRLGDLTEDEADQLLTQADGTPHPFTPAEQRMVYRLAGANPYYLQVVCWQLWEAKADGRRVTKNELRRFLCDQPNPPAACAKPQLPHPAWIIAGGLLILVIILCVLLAWQAPTFAQRVRTAIWETSKAIWEALEQFGDFVGGLLAFLVVGSVLFAGIKKRQRIREVLRTLWERLM